MNRLIRTCILSSMIIVTCAVTTLAQSTAQQTLIERARLLDAQGRHELAAENWRQVLLIDPRQREGIVALADYYRSVGNKEKAQYYRGMLGTAHPEDAGQPTKAMDVSPRATDEKLNEATKLAAGHKYVEALALFKEAFGTTPPDNWAIAYYQTEAAIPAESEKGIGGLRSLAAKYPAEPRYQLALAEELTYRPATRAEGLRMISRFHGSAYENEQARKAWRAAILWDASSPAAKESAKEYLERYPDVELTAQMQATEPKASTIAEASPEEGLGYRALSKGDVAEASSHFNAMTKDLGHAARGEVGLGYVSMRQKDFQAAVDHFESARSKGVHSATLDKALKEARYWSAMSSGNQALQSNDVTTASTEFENARKVDARRPEASEALAGTMMAAKDPQQAEQIFAADVKNNPSRPDAWIGWMNSLLGANKSDRVLAIQQTMPAAVRAQLVHRPDYLAMLLCAELAQGNQADSRMLRARIAAANDATGTGDANVEAARLLLQYGYFDDASKLSVAALNRDMNNVDAWLIVIQAEHLAGRDRNAMTMISRMPHAVNVAVMGNQGFLIALASIYQSEGQLENAKSLMDQADKLAATDQASLTSLQMQKASLAQAQGDAHLAFQIYRKIAVESPDQLDAWIGMLSSLHAGNKDVEALTAMHDLPEKVSNRLRHDTAFLQIAGFIYSATGHAQEALLCLRAVTDHYNQQHQSMPFGAGIELAWLQLNTGDQRELATTLDRLGKLRGLSLSQTIAMQKVWAAWSMRRAETSLASGNAQQATTILLTALKAYPSDSQLRTQLAGMYVRTGHAAQGMKIFQGMDWNNATVDQFTAGINAALATHSMSDARYWLYLSLEKYPGNTALLRAGAHMEERKGDLKAAEKFLNLAAAGESPNDIPAQPSSDQLASADQDGSPAHDNEPVDSKGSDLARLLAGSDSSTGNAAAASLPSPSHIKSDPMEWIDGPSKPAKLGDKPLTHAVSSNYMKTGAYYQNEQPNLVRVDQGQAAAESSRTQDSWLDDDRSQTGEDNISAARKAQDSVADPLRGRDLGMANTTRLTNRSQGTSVNASRSLEDLLDNNSDAQKETVSPAASGELEARLLGNSVARPGDFSSSLAISGRSGVPADPAMVRASQPKQEPGPADELADLEAHYGPMLLVGGTVSSHSGTAGFDHLQDYEGELAASTVLGIGAARISVITRPVMLQAGVPDGASNYRFGSGTTLPTDAQFAAGSAASVEVATHNLQASIGISPSGFLVKNFVGGVTFRPLTGPFTFNMYRNSQRDSLLSYAGIKDPSTGQIWGGVVATGGSMQYAHGGATSGFYASIDGQKLTGVNVTDNTRVMGNAGAYWLAYSNDYGNLKIGANLTAMHYALNERYFTIGQGGYFSPDAFLLMNAPISWEGRAIHNTTYMIGGSLGTQSIQESAAMPGSLIAGTGVETTAGASYDLHLKVAHRMDAHWTLEGFLDANNARQYAETSAGFSVRYASRPQTGDAAGLGYVNVMEPLPLQIP